MLNLLTHVIHTSAPKPASRLARRAGLFAAVVACLFAGIGTQASVQTIFYKFDFMYPASVIVGQSDNFFYFQSLLYDPYYVYPPPPFRLCRI